VSKPLPGVRYLAYPPGSGFGEAAEDYISALRAGGIPVSWNPLAWGSDAWGPLHQLAPFTGRSYGPFRHDDICNLPIAPDTILVHSPPLWYEPWAREEPAPRRIACTTYETDRLPAERVAILNRYDLVLVPSTHNREAFRQSGVRPPIQVIPHISRPAHEVRVGGLDSLTDDLFVFYTINTWTARKALPETILAFLETFTAQDRVALVVKTTAEDHVALERSKRGLAIGDSRHAGTTSWSLARLLAGRRNPPRVHLIAGEVPRQLIDELHTRGNCFLSLARGEGWGLGAFEAAAYGNPVVVTGWGGQVDFLPREYPYCVDYRLVPAVEDEPDDWFHPEPSERWARPDFGHAGALMRRVFQERAEAGRWGARLADHVTQNFSAEIIGPQLVSAIRDSAA
jgi:glycosyltransferase involved in cell wall biosynthesis